MKTKIYFLSLTVLVLSMLMVSCEHDNVTPEKEKEIITAVYQSLQLTPAQFGEELSKNGLHEVSKSEKGMTYANSYRDYDDRVLIGISYNDNSIKKVTYERYLNKETNIAASYKLFSDMIADYNYASWQGFYQDPATIENLYIRGDDYSSMTGATNREDLLEHIKNEHLKDPNSLQSFLELFTYTHSDESTWNGKILMYTTSYFSGLNEGDGGVIKDIHLSFTLERQ